jgi:hypothetical protein
MMESDLDAEIDALAVEVEQTISNTRKFIERLPAFAPRTRRNKLNWSKAKDGQ